ncbi:unnamed protein product [Bursaphelenchus okinawaensis]|uniref:Domain of unknown function DB domain-containing protein n=1 Tax=Bursaphelenchus okinawaensis TaxID=465554 RepID=A0A811K535_9BILA|nr:unnamed protein product [Bursaphelenchus okinawaensis]CAG9091534.1 unnamed protein product [Bursaphelenchus okinawaensis]
MKVRSLLLILGVLGLVHADLPSCLRARCSHCNISFIAQMCPNTCGQCGVDASPVVKPTTHAISQSARSPVVHGQPNYAGTAPLQNIPPPGPIPDRSHSYSYSGYNNAQGIPQARQLPQSVPAQPQTTQYGHSYQPEQTAPFATAPNQAPVQPPPAFQQPQQQFYAGQQQVGGIQAPQQQQFGVPPSAPAPQQPYGVPTGPAGQAPGFPAQPTGLGVTPAPPGLFNPFQPFLAQSFQAQQPYNPFAFPTLPPPATIAPFTPAPPLTAPTMAPLFTLPTPPAPTPAPATFPQQQVLQQPQPFGAQQPSPFPTQVQQPQTSFQQPQGFQQQQGFQQPNYQQPPPHQLAQPTYQQPQPTYQQSQPVEAPKPQPTYTQPEQVQPARPAEYQQPQPVATQPEPVQQPSIDASPVQVEKNNYVQTDGKSSLSGALAGTCPKQPNWEPCISKELANERFRNCCQRLGDGCSQLCSYDSTLTTIQLAVLTGRCPISKVADMMVCASGYEDATPCCQAYNVFEPGFEHCRPYCNPAAGLPNDGMLAEKYRCLGKLSQIQRCFYVSQRP